MKEFKKTEDGKLEVKETKEVVETLDFADLKQQREDFRVYAEAELERFDTLIKEAKKLGIKEKLKDITTE